MKKKKQPLDANRTVTVTILARHAFNLAQNAERNRLELLQSSARAESDDLKAMLRRTSDEWGRTADTLAGLYEVSLAT